MSIFKAYDIRGIYKKELDDELAYKIGRAFVSFIKPKTVVVGRDIRLSSEKLFKALTKGITEQGCDVIDIGLSSTPQLYFAVANYGYDSGINITASHNTKQYNGFKMVVTGALPLSGDTGIYDIQKLVEKNRFNKPKKKGKIIKKQVLDDYAKHILSFVDKEKIKHFKIVIDAANAMSALIAPKLFSKLGCDVKELFFKLDGRFPNHLPNPLEEKNTKQVRKKVVKEKANLGLAFDGDADRMFFIDEKGNIVPADLVAALVAEKLLLEKPKSKILYDLRSSWILKETINSSGGIPVMSRVGHSFIKQRMRKENAIFASELSAHYYLKANFFIESPFIMAFKVMEIMAEKDKTLSELIEPLKKYFASGEINFTVKDKEQAMKELEHKYSKQNPVHVSHLDGIRLEFSDWWFNVRQSNTEPLLRLNLEAKTKEVMQEKRDEIAEIIKSFA